MGQWALDSCWNPKLKRQSWNRKKRRGRIDQDWYRRQDQTSHKDVYSKENMMGNICMFFFSRITSTFFKRKKECIDFIQRLRQHHFQRHLKPSYLIEDNQRVYEEKRNQSTTTSILEKGRFEAHIISHLATIQSIPFSRIDSFTEKRKRRYWLKKRRPPNAPANEE